MIIDFPEKYFHHHEVNELSKSALQMAALGSEPRLSLFRLLVVAGNQGLFTGMISEQLKIAGSTLNHHLATLETAGLIRRIREGRNIRCVVQTDEIDDLISYLTRNCCAGLDGGCEHD